MDRDHSQQMAQTAMEFMKRVDLKGAEVGPFVAVTQWLMRHIEPGAATPQKVGVPEKDGDEWPEGVDPQP